MSTQTQAEQQAEQQADHLGMTEEQWAQWQAYTHGFGEEVHARSEALIEEWQRETDRWKDGVDEDALRANLRLTPWERLEQHGKESNEYHAWLKVREAAVRPA